MTSLIKKGIGLAMALLLLTGCAKDEVGGVSISSGETMQLYAVTNVSQEVGGFVFFQMADVLAQERRRGSQYHYGVNNLYESYEDNTLGRVGHHLWG